MKEVNLTNREKLNLENELRNYKSHRDKKFKNLVATIIIGNIIGGTIAVFNYGSRNGKLFFGLLAVMVIMLIPIGIAFLLSKKGIDKLSSDLKKGKKIEGKAIVKTVNIFNRKILLSNGIKVFEPIEEYKTFKKGDLIKYKVSPSNEYIFECKKE